MANTATLLKQFHGVNGKITIVQIAVSGNYPGDPGEVVNLTASTLLNPGAQTVTGPNGFPDTPPQISDTSLGGWRAELKQTATAGIYNLSYWNGTTELTAIAYPAVISNGVVVVWLTHGIGS